MSPYTRTMLQLADLTLADFSVFAELPFSTSNMPRKNLNIIFKIQLSLKTFNLSSGKVTIVYDKA